MKMYDVLNILDFCKSIKDCKLSIKTAYKFNKLVLILQKEADFYSKQLTEILRQFGEKDTEGNFVLTEDKNSIVIQHGREEECSKKIAELQNLEVEKPNIIFKIGELEILNLSISDMSSLMPLIEE